MNAYNTGTFISDRLNRYHTYSANLSAVASAAMGITDNVGTEPDFVAKTTQTNAVVDLLLQWIDDGKWLPGQTVDETEVMAACNVSRTPVREALIRLEADGLAIRHPRKGVQLFDPSVEQFLAILEVHTDLEALAAELAAQRIRPDQETQLRQIVVDCTALAAHAPLDRHSEYYALNLQFHEAIALASGNAFLVEMIKLNARKLMAHYRVRYATPGAMKASAIEHEEIARHILNRNPEHARSAMVAHFNYDRETIMNMIASVR